MQGLAINYSRETLVKLVTLSQNYDLDEYFRENNEKRVKHTEKHIYIVIRQVIINKHAMYCMNCIQNPMSKLALRDPHKVKTHKYYWQATKLSECIRRE